MGVVKTKKIYFALFLIILTFSSLLNYGYASSNHESTVITAKNFVNTISSKHSHFSDWKTSKLSGPTPLYSENGDIKAYIFHLDKSKETVGYFILDSQTYKVLEFARGESPYQSPLDMFKAKKVKNKIIEEEILVYGGQSYYILGLKTKEDEKIKFYEILEEINEIKIDRDNMIKDENNNTITSSVENEKYLSDVADLKWYNGCAPTAGANLIYYWSFNGYQDLTYYKTSREVIEDLASYMKTTSKGTTNISNINQGILDYIYWNLGSNWSESLVSYPSWSSFKYEIDRSRPVLLSIINDSSSHKYGSHTVTGAGYYYVADENYSIIHDTWDTTPKKVYYLYPTSIRYMHKFIPN